MKERETKKKVLEFPNGKWQRGRQKLEDRLVHD
jgi:hypothetical protein